MSLNDIISREAAVIAREGMFDRPRQQMVGRPPKLTPAQAAELRVWAAQRMTLAEKARELGIGLTAAKNYISGAHKRREYA